MQKYVETLDMLKIKNSMPASNGVHSPIQVQQRHSNGQRKAPPVHHEQKPRHSNGHSFTHLSINQQPPQQQQASRHSTSGPVVVTTMWETFDSTPGLVPSTSNPATNNNSVHPKFNWEFFE